MQARHDHEQKSHHQVQIGEAKTSLKDAHRVEIDEQLDRDGTCIWKQQFMHSTGSATRRRGCGSSATTRTRPCR